MKFEFLGTADTGGIPLLGCSCDVCEQARKEGRCNRSTSAYLTLEDGSVILFDAGDDTLSDRFNTTKIRAVFLTHFHADHCLGLIRLRKATYPIVCYTPQDSNGFGDLFVHKDSIEYAALKPFESVGLPGLQVVAVPLAHSKPTYGYLISTPKSCIAYLTDCESMPEETLAYLKEKKIDHLFLDACYTPEYPYKKHLNWESATAYIQQLEVKKGYLIHASCKTLLPLHVKKIRLDYPYITEGFHIEI